MDLGEIDSRWIIEQEFHRLEGYKPESDQYFQSQIRSDSKVK